MPLSSNRPAGQAGPGTRTASRAEGPWTRLPGKAGPCIKLAGRVGPYCRPSVQAGNRSHQGCIPCCTIRPEASPEDRSVPSKMQSPGNLSIQLGLMPILQGPASLLSARERMKLDMQPDAGSPNLPCMMHHTDIAFRSRLSDLYLSTLEPGSCVLDLCSSFASHLPSSLRDSLACVEGLGLSQLEMDANPTLTGSCVQDLNQEPRLPYQDGSFDAVLCCCGVAYLQYPEAVAAEMARVMVPDGIAVVSFSSHCYAEKATVAWLERSASEQIHLIQRILLGAGLQIHEEPLAMDAEGADRGSNSSNSNGQQAMDPFYVVIARKQLREQFQYLSGQPAESAAAARLSAGIKEGLPGGAPEPADQARQYVVPALREMDELRGRRVSQETAAIAASLAGSTGLAPAGPNGFTSPALEGGDSFSKAAETEASGELSLSASSSSGSPAVGPPANVEPAGWADGVSSETLERWRQGYLAMAREARQLGIPASALPQLGSAPSAAEVREARDYLQDMIASFMSSGL